MRKCPLLRSTAALAILAALVLAGCDIFSMPESEQPPSPFIRGEIGFVYLNLNVRNRLSPNDTGRMAMLFERIHKGPSPSLSLRPVTIVADLPGNNPANDVTVDVINNWRPWEVGGISFKLHYAVDSYFPQAVTIIIGSIGRNPPFVSPSPITGTFSTFNHEGQTYSVTFSSATGANVSFNDLILNRRVFELHEEESQGLTNTQNIRLNRIMTTLAIWSSLQQQIAETDEEDASSVQNMVARALSNASFTAAVALAIPSDPEAIITPDAVIAPAPQIIPRLHAADGAISPLARSSTQATFLLPPPPRPPASAGLLPKVTVTLDSKPVENNRDAPFRPGMGESLNFQIAVTNSHGLDYRNIIDAEYLFFLFDPISEDLGGMLHPLFLNAPFFDFEVHPFSYGIINLTISRVVYGQHRADGIVQVVIRFPQFVKINGNANGYIWDGEGPWDREALTEATEGGYLFILNFSSNLTGV